DRKSAQLSKNQREPAVPFEECRITPCQRLGEDRPQTRETDRQRDPDDHDKATHRGGSLCPGGNSRDPREQEETQESHDSVDHHRRDRLRSLDLHPREEGRLEKVAPDGSRNQDVEDIADEAEQERVAKPETWLDHADQPVPADERHKQPGHVDGEPKREEPAVDPVAQDLANQFALSPDRQEQQPKGKRDPDQIDQQGPQRVFLLHEWRLTRQRGLNAIMRKGSPWSTAPLRSEDLARKPCAARGPGP